MLGFKLPTKELVRKSLAARGPVGLLAIIRRGLLLVGMVSFVHPAGAVLFFSTKDPTFNTSPPALAAGGGWNYEGVWGEFTGTAIAPRYFITAKHLGGSAGNPFVFHGVQYTTTAFYDDPTGDLRIWHVSGTFPVYAQIYTRQDETGKEFILIGRGKQRGPPVWVNGVLKGWSWGVPDSAQRWGINWVDGTANDGANVGDVLVSSFKPGARGIGAAIADGDSGGAMFINDNGVYKLAGIITDADGPYNINLVGPTFDASLLDQGGLFSMTSGQWEYVAPATHWQPTAFWGPRISSRAAWIGTILAQPGS